MVTQVGFDANGKVINAILVSLCDDPAGSMSSDLAHSLNTSINTENNTREHVQITFDYSGSRSSVKLLNTAYCFFEDSFRT